MKRSVNIVLLVLTVTLGQVGVTQAQWYFGPSMNYARHGLDVVDYENKMYAIGGWNGGTILEVFENGVWSELQPLPQSQQGLAAAIVGNKIYTFGSYGWSNITQIYDIQTDTWITGPTIPQGLYWSTAEAIGDSIYLIAGYSSSGPLNTLYIFNTITNTWTQGSNLPSGIQIPASSVYNAQIYVFGSYGSYYVYDVETDTWSPFNGPPSGHGNAAEAVTVGNEIYLIGGNSGYIYEAYRTVEIYDLATQQWSAGDSLNTGRYQFGATYFDGSLYAVGGRDESASSINTVEILDVEASPVTISLTPLNPPIIIPANGGSFDFNAMVTNNETDPITFDAWIMVDVPGIGWSGPVLGPINLTLSGGASLDRDRTQGVPAGAPAGTYTYEGRVGTYPDVIWHSDSFTFEKLATGDGRPETGWANTGEGFEAWLTAPEVEVPSDFRVSAVYPNPFNPSTTISFALPEASQVKLTIFDLQGRTITELVNGRREAGIHEVAFDGSGLASGVYIHQFQAGEFTASGKMVLMK